MNTIQLRNIEKLEYGRHEAMNSLRSNLMFSGEGIKSIMITSCAPEDGKSTISFDLARSFAENGNRTVLLDMDFRKTVMMQSLNINLMGQRIFGLEHLLSGMSDAEDVICETNIPNLHIGMAGGHVANPTGLLDGESMKQLLDYLNSNYDAIIIDTPPVGAVIDAAILAPLVDGVVLLVSYDTTRRAELINATKQLERTGANILGVAINRVPKKKDGYYYYSEYKYKAK